jgi:hypothetical protein
MHGVESKYRALGTAVSRARQDGREEYDRRLRIAIQTEENGGGSYRLKSERTKYTVLTPDLSSDTSNTHPITWIEKRMCCQDLRSLSSGYEQLLPASFWFLDWLII